MIYIDNLVRQIVLGELVDARGHDFRDNTAVIAAANYLGYDLRSAKADPPESDSEE